MNVCPFIEAEKAQQRNVKRACELLEVSGAAFCQQDHDPGPGRRGPRRCDPPRLHRRCVPAQRPVVRDITYIRTWQGWLFLATVIDIASRRVVG